MSLIKDRQFANERRSCMREHRTFSVRINNDYHEGLDVSKDGFSIVCSQQEAFLLGNQFTRVEVISEGVTYHIDAIQVKSYRTDGFNKIYGFVIKSISMRDSINHNFLVFSGVKHEHKINNCYQKTPPAQSLVHDMVQIPKAALEKMKSTLNEPMFDNQEKLDKIRSYLNTIDKKHKLN